MSLMITFSVVPFSVRLAIIRAARLLSQADVAEMAGIDKSLISRYERGLAPTERHVEAIEKALKVDFDAPEMEQAFKVLSRAQSPLAGGEEIEELEETGALAEYNHRYQK